MNFQTLTLRETGAVLEISLNNPPINLMSGKMVEELFQLTGYLINNRDIRVVVLDSANPDFFVAHFDLEDLEGSATDPSKASRYPDINVLQSLGLAWQNLPQVKIAKVDGRCRGGGFEFILALDMRFASHRSLFCFPEASAGFLASGGGTTRVALAAGPEVVAMHRAAFGHAFSPIVEPLFAAMAAENEGMQAALAGPEMQGAMAAHLKLGQTREVELDLPASLATLLAKN